MPTFQAQADQIKTGTVTIFGKEAHHLKKVLRIKQGEKITLTDGKGGLFEGTVSDLNQEVSIRIIKELNPPPSPYPVHLFISLLKSEKLEFIIQKAVELNIESVHLIETDRSVRKEISPSKWTRFCRLAEAAHKQCGRAHPLKLFQTKSLRSCLDDELKKKTTHFFFYEHEKKNGLKNVLSGTNPPYAIWIGPEGGWSEIEVQLLTENNFIRTSLGSLILRSETAAMHALSSVIALVF